MLYQLQPGETIQSAAKVFGYKDDYKTFFKLMRYVGDRKTFTPGTVIECPSASPSSRDRAYDGQSHTDMGLRGQTFVQGLTMRDISDCYFKAILQSSGVLELNKLAEADNIEDIKHAVWHQVNWAALDPVAISQNLTCEVERMMGIFPNVPEVEHEG